MFSSISRCARSLFLIICLIATASNSTALAQANNAPAQPMPSNVTVPGKMYVLEAVVVVVLFAAAIYGVCRGSSRT